MCPMLNAIMFRMHEDSPDSSGGGEEETQGGGNDDRFVVYPMLFWSAFLIDDLWKIHMYFDNWDKQIGLTNGGGDKRSDFDELKELKWLDTLEDCLESTVGSWFFPVVPTPLCCVL